MKNSLLLRTILCVLFISVPVFGFADQEDMAVQEWLDGYGLLNDNRLLIEWVERAPLVADTYVAGCRLESLIDKSTFDVYFNSDGLLLDEQYLDDLGILTKTWGLF